MHIIQSLCQLGKFREKITQKDYNGPWFDKTTSLTLICPITSVFFGIGRLQDIFKQHNQQKINCFTKVYYFTTGIIAFLGLGFILVALKILLIFSVSIFVILVFLPYTGGVNYVDKLSIIASNKSLLQLNNNYDQISFRITSFGATNLLSLIPIASTFFGLGQIISSYQQNNFTLQIYHATEGLLNFLGLGIITLILKLIFCSCSIHVCKKIGLCVLILILYAPCKLIKLSWDLGKELDNFRLNKLSKATFIISLIPLLGTILGISRLYHIFQKYNQAPEDLTRSELVFYILTGILMSLGLGVVFRVCIFTAYAFLRIHILSYTLFDGCILNKIKYTPIYNLKLCTIITLLFPITSIGYGIKILKCNDPSEKISCITIGLLLLFGLGSIIIIFKILSSLINSLLLFLISGILPHLEKKYQDKLMKMLI